MTDNNNKDGERFAKIPDAFFTSRVLRQIRPSELKVYLVLCRYANFNTGSCFPSAAKISDESGVSRTRVFLALKKLVDVGLIQKRRAPKALNFKNVFRVLRDPQITPSSYPLFADKRRGQYRKKGGQWGVRPRSADDHSCPRSTDTLSCPSSTDEKENELKGKRDSFKNPLLTISPEIIKEIMKVRGREGTIRYMREHGYPLFQLGDDVEGTLVSKEGKPLDTEIGG